MPALPSFADFMSATRDVKITTKDTLLNEVGKHTYLLDAMLKGADTTKTFKGGSKLVDRIQAVDAGTFSFYSPNQRFSPSQVDTLKTVEVPWAFAQSHYVLTKETILLNGGDENAYVSLKMAIENSCLVDTLNGMENALWASPNADTMENAAAQIKVAYSIPCFITRDGLVPSSSNGGIASGSTAWSTLETLNPSTESWFRNQVATYLAAAIDDPDSGLISRFDRMVERVKFEMPKPGRKVDENDSLSKMKILTSEDGKMVFMARLRAANDRLNQLKDPSVPGAQYMGMPVEYIAELDNAGWTTGSPDYFFLNLKYLAPFFHTDMYMNEEVKDGGAAQPHTTVVYKFTWYNLFCRSRRRQGRISASTTGSAS